MLSMDHIHMAWAMRAQEKAHERVLNRGDLCDATSRRPMLDGSPDLDPRPCSEIGEENDKRRRDSVPEELQGSGEDTDGTCC